MITRKIKIGKKFYSCFRSIQNIAHHLQPLKKKIFFLDFENAWVTSWIFFKIQKKIFLLFFWNFFFLKYRHSAEEKIEPIFRFFRFLFFELWPFLCHFFEKSVNFRGKKKSEIFFITSPFDSEHCAPYPIIKRGGHF